MTGDDADPYYHPWSWSLYRGLGLKSIDKLGELLLHIHQMATLFAKNKQVQSATSFRRRPLRVRYRQHGVCQMRPERLFFSCCRCAVLPVNAIRERER